MNFSSQQQPYIPHCPAYLFLLLLLSLSGPGLLAQTITGRVQERDGKPAPYVNILLLNSKDSSLVKGAASDDYGAYRIEGIKSGSYLLAGSMIGYRKTYLPLFTLNEGQIEIKAPLLVLDLEEEELKAVTIEAVRPFIEEQIDRTVVNVANSIIASGGTALEVLEKAPGVTVDRQNDAIALRGKEGVIVQIDGRQTYLSMADVVALLRNMPSDNIDKIELITNPSAKYDAAGNSGIINIRMKKDGTTGTNGTVSLAGGTGRHGRQRANGQLNYRKSKLSLSGNYSANRGGNYFIIDSEQQMLKTEKPTVIKQDTQLEFLSWGQNAKGGLDYILGKNTTLGLIWTGFWSNHEEEGPASSFFRHRVGGPPYLQAITEKELSRKISNQVANFNIQHTFSNGGQLSADIDLGRFRREFFNNLITETTRAGDPSSLWEGLLNQMPTIIDIRTYKIDYTRPVSEGWKMEAGLKHSDVRTDNDLTLSMGPLENLQPDPLLSNHFRYTEQVNAAYMSISGKLGPKTDLQLGLRGEHTHSIGHSLTLDQRVERNYINLFPSLFLSRPLNEKNALVFSYSRRIDRPNYELLNPARWYADPYLYSQGNPYLQPQYTHSLELKHSYKQDIYTSLGASYTNDMIFYVIQPVSSTTTERTPLNIGHSQNYNLTFSFPLRVVKGWNLQTTLFGYYSQFQYIYMDRPFTVQQISGRLNGTNSFLLGKGWTAELAGWINTPRVHAIVRIPWLGSVDAGLQKEVGTRLKAKLSLQDIFHTNGIIGTIDTPDFISNFRLAFDTRVLMLNLTYTFGNQQLKKARQRKTGSEEEMNRTN
jgi:hypothetical protein